MSYTESQPVKPWWSIAFFGKNKSDGQRGGILFVRASSPEMATEEARERGLPSESVSIAVRMPEPFDPAGFENRVITVAEGKTVLENNGAFLNWKRRI